MKKVNQGKQKLLNYMDRFIDSDYFQNYMIALRKRFEIPLNGFKLPKELRNRLIRNATLDKFFHIPEALKNRKHNILKDVNMALKDLTKKFPIDDIQILFVFKIYLFYNTKLYEALEGGIDEVNLCRIEDIKDELEEYDFLAPPQDVVAIFKRKFKNYPIALKLHPSISQRDLLNYIKHYWPIISFYLGQYKDKKSMLGKIRNGNSQIKRRNKFIYEHRNLRYKKIVSLVGEHFPENISKAIDEGSVGKIISLERKKRKEV